VRKRSPENCAVFTAREKQIGRHARDGLSTPEISGQIFITARTVEWHLRKEFTKLGITLARCRLGRASCDSSSFRCRGSRRAGSRRAHEGRVGAPLALA
jgi:DNA-binding NarL/FixJ family response regulator